MNSGDADDDIKLLGYASTRFLGLKTCIERILKHFYVLQEFFFNKADTSIALEKSFEHSLVAAANKRNKVKEQNHPSQACIHLQDQYMNAAEFDICDKINTISIQMTKHTIFDCV